MIRKLVKIALGAAAASSVVAFSAGAMPVASPATIAQGDRSSAEKARWVCGPHRCWREPGYGYHGRPHYWGGYGGPHHWGGYRPHPWHGGYGWGHHGGWGRHW